MSNKTVGEQLADLENTRAAKAAQMENVAKKSIEAGETMDADDAESFDTLEGEVKALDADIARLRRLEKLQAEKATPVAGGSSIEAGRSRDGVTVKTVEKLEPGIQFARHAMCVYAAKGNTAEAAQIAHAQYGENSPVARVLKSASGRSLESVIKATVAAGTTQDDEYAAPLVAYNNYAGDFVEFLRPRTILGRFGSDGIPSLRRIPFNVHIKGVTSGGTGYWVGEGAPKPVTSFGFNSVYHGWTKVAGIAVLTDELIRFSDPSAQSLVRDLLADALVERMDTDFLDPAFAGSANVSPASITNGITAIPSSGNDAAAVRADLMALWAAADDANHNFDSPVYIMRAGTARALGAMVNPLGQSEFGSITPRGGSLGGVPVIVSNYAPAGTVILVNASDIYYSDDGQATVDFSREASIQMLDNPTNNSATGTPTTLVSMFQTDSTAIRAHRFVNWSRRRDTGVAVLSGVAWGEEEVGG
jgi:HK97 family phage major capsid protein